MPAMRPYIERRPLNPDEQARVRRFGAPSPEERAAAQREGRVRRWGEGAADVPVGFKAVPEAQRLAAEGVQAYGELVRPDLLRDIGETLGGLNSIGALRSGGTAVALNDLTQTYADRIGAFARSASLDALNTGLQAPSIRANRRLVNEQRKGLEAERRGAFLRDLGNALGSGIGFYLGSRGSGGSGTSGKA